MMEELIVT